MADDILMHRSNNALFSILMEDFWLLSLFHVVNSIYYLIENCIGVPFPYNKRNMNKECNFM